MKKIIFSSALLAAAFASAQNTGIGTTNPQEKLDVNGNIRVSSGAKIYAPGRLHISGDETLYLLNKNGVRISKAWEGDGSLTVEGGLNLVNTPEANAADRVLLRNADGWVTSKSINDILASTGAGINLYNSNGQITSARTVDINGKTVTWNNGENIFNYNNAFRLVQNNLGLIFRNDGDSFYLLPSTENSGLGVWTSNRPFGYNFGSKNVFLNANDDDGNVGVGTTNPTQKLDVNGAFVQVQGIGFNGEKQLAYIGADGANNDIQVGSLNPNVKDVSFYNAATGTFMDGFMENLQINDKLNVAGNTSVGGRLDIIGRTYLQTVDPGAATDNILVRGNDGVVRQVPASTYNSSANVWLKEQTTTPATSPSDNIYHTGWVGIGTDKPQSSLDVRGTIIAQSSTNDGMSLISQDGSLELYRNPNSTTIPSSRTMGYIDYKSNPNLDGEVRLGVDKYNGINSFYLYNSPSGIIDDSTGTTPFFVNLSGGKVGINNTKPDAALHVISADNITAQFASSGAETVLRMMPNNSLDNRFAVVTNGTTKDTSFNGFANSVSTNIMTLKHESGNVGIGTSNPLQKLHIAEGSILVEDSTTWSGVNLYNYSSNGPTNVLGFLKGRGNRLSPQYPRMNDILGMITGRDAINGYDLTNYGGAGIEFVAGEDFSATSKGTRIAFGTTPLGGTTQTTRMLIDTQGNVGIGTLSPTKKLEIFDGEVKVVNINKYSGISQYNYSEMQTTNVLGLLRARGTQSLPQYPIQDDILGSVTGRDAIDGYNLTNYGGASIDFVAGENFSSTNKGTRIAFSTTDSGSNVISTKMLLSAAGNLGIGTLTPQHKLEVAGNVRANQFISATQTYPDYVFQNYYSGTASDLNPNYKFTSLAETEKFIKENGHLPGFQSAEEITKKGEFSVTETSLKSLEKIEELYLHVIELEKRVKDLEAENIKLKSSK